MKKVGFIFDGVVIVIVFLALVGGNSSTFTVYPVTCVDWFGPAPSYTFTPPATQDFSNCHHPEAMERQTFSVDTSKDQVVQTSPDTSDVHKLDYCTIQDGQHWSCGDGGFSKMPGGIFASTQISRGGDKFNEYGLTAVIFVTESEWNSINNGKTSICGLKYCDAQ